MARRYSSSGGFTLVEIIVVIVILAIISAVMAVFIRTPVEGYFAAVHRAELVDVADTALRRMGRDIRRAVPNSVRVACQSNPSACFLEFLPTTSGGRYRAAGEGTTQCPSAAPTLYDSLNFNPEVDTCFEILGPQMTFSNGDQIVISNWGNPGSDAYEGNTVSTHVRRAYAGTVGAATSKVLMNSTNPLPLESPSRRFQVISGSELAVTYACENIGVDAGTGDGTGTLTRYWGYGIQAAQPTSFAAGSHAAIAEFVSSCNMIYGSQLVTNPYTRNGIVAMLIGITRGNETVNLYHEIHVDNLP